MTDVTGIAPLPPRHPSVVAGLSEAFAHSQIDALPRSVTWHQGSWMVSTDAWQDRRLGLLDRPSGRWQEFDAPAGWTRQPMSDVDGGLAVLVHDRNADHGRLVARRSGDWEELAAGVGIGAVTDWDGSRFALRDGDGQAAALTRTGGRVRVHSRDGQPRIVLDGIGADITLPPGVTVTQLSPSPDRELILVVVRLGSAQQSHVYSLRTGRPLGSSSFRLPVHGEPVWLDNERIVVVVERWPSLVPMVWHWRFDHCECPWPSTLIGTVRSVAVAPDGTCVTALSTPSAARQLRRLDQLDGPAPDQEIRSVIVRRGNQELPCLVYEPSTALRGTVLYFPGGPHEPMWAEHSPFSQTMNDDGWRVVRVNVRSSGLREKRFRADGSVRFGIDDVQDALAVIEALGDGPVVTMGMSYGGYIAAMAGERSSRCQGIVVLSGFLSRRDLDRTRHPDVRRFSTEAFVQMPPEPTEFTKPVFIAHGSEDPRIPIDVVRAHAGRTGSDFTFLELTGQGHAILSDHDARSTYPEVLAWLRTKVPHPSRHRSTVGGSDEGDNRERLPA